MTRLHIASYAALVVCVLFSLPADAQAPSSSLPEVSAATLGPARSPQDPALQLTAPDPELWTTQRRMRLLLAAGSGMLVGSAVHLGWATPRRVCVEGREPHRGSLYGAAIFGGIGISFLFGGASGLSAATKDQRYPATRGQIIGATALALGTAITAQGLLGILFALESAGACAS